VILVLLLFVAALLTLWLLVRLVDRHQRNTWGGARGEEPRAKPVREEPWLAQNRDPGGPGGAL